MAGINLLPARFPVAVTTGNDVTITLDVNDALGADYTWAGKTVVAPIVGHTTVTGFTVDTSTDGTLVLSLTDAQTTALGSDAGFEWSLSVTVGTATRTWLSGPLSVFRPGRPGVTNTTTGTLTVASSTGAAVTITAVNGVASLVTFTPTGTVAATTVQAAIAEVSGDVTTVATGLSDHLADTVAAHAASAVAFTPAGTTAATDVQAAIVEVAADAATALTNISDHISDTTDAHDASAISVLDTGGYYTGTNVETVLAELPGKFVPAVVAVGAGIDPTGVADSTSALQALISAAPDGARLILPPGIFKIFQLTIDKGKKLCGSGWSSLRDYADLLGDANWLVSSYVDGTVIRSTTTTGSAISFIDGVGVRQSGAEDFILIGPGSGSSVGITLGSASFPNVHPVWRNVHVANFATGVSMREVNEGSFYDLTVRGCTTGLYLDVNANNNAFHMLDIQRCVSGVDFDSSTLSNAFYSPIVQAVSGVGFTVRGHSHAWHNAYCEMLTGDRAFDFLSGGYHIITAPRLSNTHDGIRIANGVVNVQIFTVQSTAAAPIINAGQGTVILGDTAYLTDTGDNTTFIDPNNVRAKFPKFVGNVATTGAFLPTVWVDSASLPSTVSADAGSYIYDGFHGIPLFSDGSGWRTAAGVLHVHP